MGRIKQIIKEFISATIIINSVISMQVMFFVGDQVGLKGFIIMNTFISSVLLLLIVYNSIELKSFLQKVN